MLFLDSCVVFVSELLGESLSLNALSLTLGPQLLSLFQLAFYPPRPLFILTRL